MQCSSSRYTRPPSYHFKLFAQTVFYYFYNIPIKVFSTHFRYQKFKTLSLFTYFNFPNKCSNDSLMVRHVNIKTNLRKNYILLILQWSFQQKTLLKNINYRRSLTQVWLYLYSIHHNLLLTYLFLLIRKYGN